MSALPPTVFVVDDDGDMRESLSALIGSAGLPVKTYESATDFLGDYDADVPGCVVLDVRMPGMSGLELQEALGRHRCDIPVIIITGHGDVPMAVRALKQGAIDFLEKPFSGQLLIDRIWEAIRKDESTRDARANRSQHAKRFEALTPREYEVFQLLVTGFTLKQVAQKLDRSPKTIEAHSTRLMKKLSVRNRVELMRVGMQAGIVKA